MIFFGGFFELNFGHAAKVGVRHLGRVDRTTDFLRMVPACVDRTPLRLPPAVEMERLALHGGDRGRRQPPRAPSSQPPCLPRAPSSPAHRQRCTRGGSRGRRFALSQQSGSRGRRLALSKQRGDERAARGRVSGAEAQCMRPRNPRSAGVPSQPPAPRRPTARSRGTP